MELSHDAAGDGQEFLALASQFHAPRVAIEQPGVELVFGGLDGPAQRRLRDVDAFGGQPEVAQLGHGQEGFQFMYGQGRSHGVQLIMKMH